MADAINDYPRQLGRSARKKIGLPASGDVGTLGNMIKALKREAEKLAVKPVTSALISVPHIVAMYDEDVVDAFEYVELQYAWLNHWRGLFWENAMGYAGYGLGLCSDYKNFTACWKEVNSSKRQPVFATTLTSNALITSFAVLQCVFGLWEPQYRMNVNVDLGYDFREEDGYWVRVRGELHQLFNSFPGFPRPTVVYIMGDKAEDPTFQNLIHELADTWGTNPPVYTNDTTFAVARGAAEMKKRAPYIGKGSPNTTEDSDSQMKLSMLDQGNDAWLHTLNVQTQKSPLRTSELAE